MQKRTESVLTDKRPYFFIRAHYVKTLRLDLPEN